VEFQHVVPSIQLREADDCEIFGLPNKKTKVDSQKNVAMTAAGRMRMVWAVLDGTPISSVAKALCVDRKTVRKWA